MRALKCYESWTCSNPGKIRLSGVPLKTTKTPRRTSLRVGASVLDQGLASASNLLMSLVIASQVSMAAFGAYGLAYAIFVICQGATRAFVGEALLVNPGGARRYECALDGYGEDFATFIVGRCRRGRCCRRSARFRDGDGDVPFSNRTSSPPGTRFFAVRVLYSKPTRACVESRCGVVCLPVHWVRAPILDRLESS